MGNRYSVHGNATSQPFTDAGSRSNHEVTQQLGGLLGLTLLVPPRIERDDALCGSRECRLQSQDIAVATAAVAEREFSSERSESNVSAAS
jgi:hypothetical protein